VENGSGPRPVSNFYEVIGDKAISKRRSAGHRWEPRPPLPPCKSDPDQTRRAASSFYIDKTSPSPRSNRNRVFKENERVREDRDAAGATRR